MTGSASPALDVAWIYEVFTKGVEVQEEGVLPNGPAPYPGGFMLCGAQQGNFLVKRVQRLTRTNKEKLRA